jgi:uncharacterized membrane-anchored protein
MYLFTAALVLLAALAIVALLPEQGAGSLRWRHAGVRLEVLVAAMLLVGFAAIGIILWHWLRLLV